jgi:hypothetical protein
MDQPTSRLSVIVVRLSILTVQPPAAPAAWRPQLPAAVRTRPRAPPDLPPHPLSLVLGSIVVLAAMSSSSGPRHRDRW